MALTASIFLIGTSHDLENLMQLYGWTVSAILLSLTSFLYLYRRQHRPTALSPTKLDVIKSSKIVMAPLPGDVHVSRILIHPIKVCLTHKIHDNYCLKDPRVAEEFPYPQQISPRKV